MDCIEAIAKATGVSAAWIMGWETTPSGDPIPYGMHAPRFRRVPRLGRIPCGKPLEEEQTFDGYDDVPDGVRCDFSLVCEGDSMTEAGILDGDIVYIRRQETVENGEIAAVSVNGEYTLKRFYLNGDTLQLLPANARYAPIVLTGNALSSTRVLGKAVGFTRIFK